MGGMGSGGHNHSGRPAVEQFRWLDATNLRRSGLLADGVRGTMSWGGEGAARHEMEVEGGRAEIVLVYAWRRGEEAWTPVRDTVPVQWCPRHLGGEEAYFECPGCRRRAKRLYFRGAHFRCRTCHRLVHASSREQTGDRAMRKVRKLRRRMQSPEGLEDVICRPRGMHQARFERMVERILEAENEVWDDSLRLIRRLQRSEARINRLKEGRAFW